MRIIAACLLAPMLAACAAEPVDIDYNDPREPGTTWRIEVSKDRRPAELAPDYRDAQATERRLVEPRQVD
jgi:hypothetical protein